MKGDDFRSHLLPLLGLQSVEVAHIALQDVEEFTVEDQRNFYRLVGRSAAGYLCILLGQGLARGLASGLGRSAFLFRVAMSSLGAVERECGGDTLKETTRGGCQRCVDSYTILHMNVDGEMVEIAQAWTEGVLTVESVLEGYGRHCVGVKQGAKSVRVEAKVLQLPLHLLQAFLELAEPNSSGTKTCYYDLLGVERDANDIDSIDVADASTPLCSIKKAYRRKALDLHPDRNLNDIEAATRKFAEVQSAYEVLSDPQERAWYDSHREAILSGQDDPADGASPTTFRNVRLTTTDEILSLMRRFNATVPFNDEPTGFFGIARETFEHLALEEETAVEFEGASFPDYPTFGSSDDNYDQVVKPFYAAWSGFSTKKSFSWKDKHRLTDAPDRRVRRLMEKENKKSREDAIREFNDAVRFLVTFVRKRDPRYLPNAHTEAERQKALRDAAAAQAARSRAANQERMADYRVPDWAGSRDDSTEHHAFPESSDEESEVELLECIVCNKTFKSVQQYDAHERSKKHTKAVQQLRRQMEKEGVDLRLNIDTSSSAERNRSPSPGSSAVASSDKTGENVEGPDVEVTNVAQQRADSGSPGPSEHSPISPDGDDDYAPRSAVEERLGPNVGATGVPKSSQDSDEDLAATMEDVSVDRDTTPQVKMGKAKAKRAKKAAAALSTAADEVRPSAPLGLAGLIRKTAPMFYLRGTF
ncbi:meiotically up-regulated protein [Purpureocillium lavendulum]|uniref:Meiotically up-regulated protein n=1 Tax=Purpureocillium lavendulum TaxID=1247861 RepID=A0AB34FR83_9HYPO|nr:meiotically up-regulated protein [Purpureocillium lavendulum]